MLHPSFERRSPSLSFLLGLVLAGVTSRASSAFQPHDLDAAERIDLRPDAIDRGRIVALGDLDEDGRLDAIGVSFDGVLVCRGLANARFAPAVIVSPFATHYLANAPRPAVADVDADGHLDLVITTSASTPESLWLLRGRGDGTFENALLVTSAFLAAPPVAVQIDGDPAMEIAWVRNDMGGARIEVFDWNGTTLVSAFLGPYVSGWPRKLVAVDLDGNGTMELLLHDRQNHALQRWDLQFGGLALQSVFPLPFANHTPSGVARHLSEIAAGDVNGDGHLDAFACTVLQDPLAADQFLALTTFQGDGTGLLTPGTPTELALPNRGPSYQDPDVILLDWNGDGRLDVAGHLDAYPTLGGSLGGERTALFRNEGVQGFAHPVFVAGPNATYLPGATDLDGDGHLDLVTDLAIVRGDGAFHTTVPELDGWRRAGEVFDADGDGDLDVVHPTPDQGVMLGTLFTNDATGSMTEGIASRTFQLLPGERIRTIMRGDFDEDGREDFLVDRWVFLGPFLGDEMRGLARIANTHGAGYEVVDLFGDMSYALQGPTFACDVNGDGHLDLTNGDRVLLGDGSGRVTQPAPLVADHVVRDAADLNGDGHPELLATHETSNLVLLRANGNGSYTQTLLSNAYAGLGNATFLDLDGDGDRDVVATTPPSVTGGPYGLQAIVNRGGGAFGTPVLLDVHTVFPAQDLTMHDANGDGHLDLFVLAPAIQNPAPRTYAEVVVAHGTIVPATFAPSTTYLTSSASGFGDLDDDGDLDVAGRVVTRGTRYTAPSSGVIRQYGHGTPGLADAIPLAGASGPIRPGHVATVRYVNALGGSLAIVMLGLGETAIPSALDPNVMLYVGGSITFLAIPLGGTPGSAGEGTLAIPFWVDPVLAGFAFYTQVYVFDPAAGPGFSSSNGVEVRVGM